MLLSSHVVNVIQDQIKYKSDNILEKFKNPSIAKDKQLVSKHVKEFIYEVMEHLLGFFTREDRALCFNEMVKRFNIKVDVENDKSKPMHIEMVRNNF